MTENRLHGKGGKLRQRLKWSSDHSHTEAIEEELKEGQDLPVTMPLL